MAGSLFFLHLWYFEKCAKSYGFFRISRQMSKYVSVSKNKVYIPKYCIRLYHIFRDIKSWINFADEAVKDFDFLHAVLALTLPIGLMHDNLFNRRIKKIS